MAQTGYTPILTYSSSTAAAAPSAGNLTNSTLGSELAINITDGKLFYKDNANAVQVIAWKNVPVSTLAGAGTGVLTALGINVGTAGAFVVNGGALGTPSSGTVTNLTGTASININGTVGATTPNTGAFTTLTTSGNATLGDASTDTVTVNGYMGVGGAPSAARSVYVQSTALTGTTQIGVDSRPVFSSAATSAGYGIISSPATAAASFTQGNLYGVGVLDATKGAGSTITNQFGIRIFDQTQGNANYGLWMDVSTAANKWNIYATGTAANYFAGNVLVGLTSANANGGILQLSSGITFPATQVAATDANTLDDYEEGTFTPTIVGTTAAGTGTYTTQVGRYTKIGNRVYFTAYIVWTAHTGTGNMRVSALPFTSNTTTGNFNAVSIWANNLTLTASNYLQAYVAVNSTQVVLDQYPVGGGSQSSVVLDTAATLIVSGQYEV